MSAPILNRCDIEFFLDEMFDVESLTNREKYQDHDRTTINGAIDTAQSITDNKAAILQNHGLLTVGETVESAVWWFIAMERCCQAQLLAQAAKTPKLTCLAALRMLPYITFETLVLKG